MVTGPKDALAGGSKKLRLLEETLDEILKEQYGSLDREKILVNFPRELDPNAVDKLLAKYRSAGWTVNYRHVDGGWSDGNYYEFRSRLR